MRTVVPIPETICRKLKGLRVRLKFLRHNIPDPPTNVSDTTGSRRRMLDGILRIAALLLLLLAAGRDVDVMAGEPPSVNRAEQRPALFLGNESLPPMNFLKQGKPTGIVIDLAEALAKHMHHPVEIQLMNWTEAQQLVLEGQADALLQINPSPERLLIYDFSDPLLTSEFTIFTSADRHGIASIQDLKGLQVGVEEKGLPIILLREDPQIMVRIIPDFLQGFRMLATGELDAVVADRWAGGYVLAENNIRGVKFIEEPISRSQSGIAVRKDHTDLLEDINSALAQIRRDGTYDKVLESWQPKEIVFQTREQLRRQAWLTAAISAALVVALVSIVVLTREIRRRRRTERTLRESEERFHLFMEHAPTIAWMKDAQGRYVYLSKNCERRFGERLEGWRGKTDFELWPREVAENLRHNDQLVLDSGQTTEVIEETPDSNGGSCYWWSFKFPFIDSFGMRFVGGVGIDISERRRSEEALRESEERFRRLFESHSAIKMLIAPDTGSIVDANQAAADFYGWPIGELKRMRIQQINMLTPEAVESAMKQVDSRSGMHFEFRHRKAAGSICDVEVFSDKISIGGQGVLYSIIHDITSRKQMEDALRESQARLDLALRSANMGAWHWDLVDNRRYFDDQTCHLLGIDPDTFTGKEEDFFARVHPDDRIQIRAALQQTIEQDQRYEVEYRVGWADESIRYIASRGRLVRHEDGRPFRLNGILWDITGWKRAEEERLRLEQRIQQVRKAESLARMAGAIAHHFNNMLGAALGNLELASSAAPPGSKLEYYLSQAIKASQRAVDISHSMLTYLGKTIFGKALLDLAATISEALIPLKVSLPGKVLLKNDFSPEEITILADSAGIKQVFANLFLNAGEAIGEEEGTVTIGLRPLDASAISEARFFPLNWKPVAERYACLSVADSGCGMDRETIERIFDPFFSTKFTGRGLGLAVTMGLVRAHEGAIAVDSQVGKGTTFRVYLPIAEVEVQPRYGKETAIPAEQRTAANVRA